MSQLPNQVFQEVMATKDTVKSTIHAELFQALNSEGLNEQKIRNLFSRVDAIVDLQVNSLTDRLQNIEVPRPKGRPRKK